MGGGHCTHERLSLMYPNENQNVWSIGALDHWIIVALEQDFQFTPEQKSNPETLEQTKKTKCNI